MTYWPLIIIYCLQVKKPFLQSLWVQIETSFRMYSVSFDYLRLAELNVVSFRFVVNAFYAILAVTCGLIVIRRVLWRRKYERIYPSRKCSALNLIGNFVEYFLISRKKGVPPNTCKQNSIFFYRLYHQTLLRIILNFFSHYILFLKIY